MTRSLMLVAVLVCLVTMEDRFAASAQEAPRPPRPGPPTIAVTGRGEVKASPDTAVIHLGAVQQAEEAQAAQDAVNKIVQAALERIKGLGIDEKQIQTAGIALHPVYDHQQPPRPMQGGQSHEPRIVGYRASNTLQIEVTDLTKVGDVIDAGIEAGANELQGLNYELREDADAKRTALGRAVDKARGEAEAVAQALGLSLGNVERVEVGDIAFRPPVPMMGRGMMMAEAAMASTPTEPGQVRVDASVTIVYRLMGQGEREGREAMRQLREQRRERQGADEVPDQAESE